MNSKMTCLYLFFSLCLFFQEISSLSMHPFGKTKARKMKHNEDIAYWKNKGKEELQESLKIHQSLNTKKAKNIILFIGDGMSLPTLTAARIYRNQKKIKEENLDLLGEEELLTFEKFPHIGLSRTYDIDSTTPDSSATASAILTGVKTKMGTVGFDFAIEYENPETQFTASEVSSILSWAQGVGKDTGIVTNTRLSHATPSAAYAHIASRDWECDAALPEAYRNKIQDISHQLISSDPGRRAKVLLGGGKTSFLPSRESLSKSWNCSRLDSRDLIQEFLSKSSLVPGFEDTVGKYIVNFQELKNALETVQDFDYILGLFSEDHMKYNHEIREENSNERQPRLAEMTELAIKVLEKNKEGFFLLVEGGKIDHAHHYTRAVTALDETIAFDEAVQMALNLTNSEETLIIVTADHGHTMSIGGYSSRGADIEGPFGTANDGLPYSILSYANGLGFDTHLHVENDVIQRKKLILEEMKKYDFIQPSTVPLYQETHSAAEVGIFATGPWSHLFHSVHEQSYIAYVMKYAGCLEEYEDLEHCHQSSSST